jgi:hypothetical protein
VEIVGGLAIFGKSQVINKLRTDCSQGLLQGVFAG